MTTGKKQRKNHWPLFWRGTLFLLALQIVLIWIQPPAFGQTAPGRTDRQPSSRAAKQKQSPAKEVTLSPAAPARQLPARFLGATIDPFYEQLINDPVKVAVCKQLHAALLRFPGGSPANYYQWQKGNSFIKIYPSSSDYTKLIGSQVPNILRSHPDGVFIEQYHKFAEEIGAEIILVPNLETASAENQAQWFKQMRENGSIPTRIEMGNEFYVAMGGDPNVEKIWPDEPTAERITLDYLHAISKYFVPGTMVAIQSAVSAFHERTHAKQGEAARFIKWDEALHPEPWFQAVTLHLYPYLALILGPAEKTASSLQKFNAVMARVDEGVDRVINDVEKRVPGKELWITEWNVKGVGPEKGTVFSTAELTHCITKMILAELRHPSVTLSTYFRLEFKSAHHPATIVAVRDGYALSSAGFVLRWFFEAANGGRSYQDYRGKSETAVPGGGIIPESFTPVEGALFRSADNTTLIVQNASDEPRLFDPGAIVKSEPPASFCVMAVPDLTAEDAGAAHVSVMSKPQGALLLPPFSVSRIFWSTHGQDSVGINDPYFHIQSHP